MKRVYISPEMETVEISFNMQLLAGSGGDLGSGNVPSVSMDDVQPSTGGMSADSPSFNLFGF